MRVFKCILSINAWYVLYWQSSQFLHTTSVILNKNIVVHIVKCFKQILIFINLEIVDWISGPKNWHIMSVFQINLISFWAQELAHSISFWVWSFPQNQDLKMLFKLVLIIVWFPIFWVQKLIHVWAISKWQIFLFKPSLMSLKCGWSHRRDAWTNISNLKSSRI